jgi:hypothetical protein
MQDKRQDFNATWEPRRRFFSNLWLTARMGCLLGLLQSDA